MKGLLGAAQLREVLERHGVRPRKALGQNFVVDPNTIRKIVAVADLAPGDHVLEIGAGAGSLTVGLAGAAAEVTALEVDQRILPALREVTETLDNVTVVEGDALGVDLAGMGATCLVANLPYNIAVPTIVRVLREAPAIHRLTVMVQKEVGERLVAAPGSPAYGRVSVVVRYFSSARVGARISRRAFWPVPGVDSIVVQMERHDALPTIAFESLDRVVTAAFSQRRKTLRNTLTGPAGSADAAARALDRAGVDPAARAEEIALEGFLAIAGEIG